MMSTVSRTRALRHLNDAFVFSAYKSTTVLLAVLAGILFFSESLTGMQMLGIVIVLVAPFFIEIAGNDTHDIRNVRKDIVLLLLAAGTGAFSALLNKVGAPIFESALMFGVFNYLFGMATGFSLQAFEHRLCADHWFLDRRRPARETALLSGLLGLFIFLAFSTLMLGFKSGPLSIVYAINSMYFVIPIILSVLFLDGKKNRKDALAVLVSLAAVVLLTL